MVKNFKKEFKNLDEIALKNIINRCAKNNILKTYFAGNLHGKNLNKVYHIIYIDDEKYGFWLVEWSFKNYKNNIIKDIFYGYFEHRIKIYPFEIEYENVSISLNQKSQLENRIFSYINNECPHYKEAFDKNIKNSVATLEM